LPFVGNNYADKLKKLGIYSIHDLLYYFPRSYQDTRLISDISDLTDPTKKYTVLVTIDSIKNIRTRSRITIQKATAHDESGVVNVTWFNQPFLKKNLREEMQIYITGKLNQRSLIPELSSPQYEVLSDSPINAARIVPVYSLTEGISSKWLRRRIHDLINMINHIENLEDDMPAEIKDKYNLMNLKDALSIIHFPETKNELISSRKRLSFDELLDIQTKLLIKRRKMQARKMQEYKISESDLIVFSGLLPFKLSESQHQACKDLIADLSSGHLMHRLIQGDVGSGKTVVALFAAYASFNNGFQTVMMAPTSILAEQHFSLAKNIFSSLKHKPKIALATRSTIKDLDQSVRYDLIIATHAILHHKDAFIKKLGLLVVDEEHKFGVAQRDDLSHFENSTPKLVHYLSLTATPIPRSIALTLFGDMDMSQIKQLKDRKVIKTLIVPDSKRADSIKWIKTMLDNDSQIFWICPLIEDNPDFEAKSVDSLFDSLTAYFPKKHMGKLYGKLKAEEKTKIIANFRNLKYRILVSTTVVEVGIDIPTANLIIIENADRFGLAQLHQLRGRVGRNSQDAWCLLFSNSTDKQAQKRLRFFANESNGNNIAEFDLQTRGPGEVYGNIQSGIPSLKIARFSNSEQLLQTREAALYLLDNKK